MFPSFPGGYPVRIIEKPSMKVGGITDGKNQTYFGVFRRFKDGPTTVLASFADIKRFNQENGTRIKQVSPGLADRILRNPEISGFLVECSLFPTDIFIGYERPGHPLGREIVFPFGDGRFIMPTGRFSGSLGMAIAASGVAADDLRRDGSDIYVDIPESKLAGYAGFPEQMGWHMTDHDARIPHGPGGRGSRDSRYAVRMEGPYVGPVCRCINRSGAGSHIIMMNIMPGAECGVAVGIPHEDLATFGPPDMKSVIKVRIDEPPDLAELVRMYERLLEK